MDVRLSQLSITRSECVDNNDNSLRLKEFFGVLVFVKALSLGRIQVKVLKPSDVRSQKSGISTKTILETIRKRRQGDLQIWPVCLPE